MPCLSPGLSTVVMGDGTRCLLDNNTLWIPAGNPVDFTLVPGNPHPTLLQPGVLPSTHITLPTAVHPAASPVFKPAVPQPPSPGISGTVLPSSQLDLQLIRPEVCMAVVILMILEFDFLNVMSFHHNIERLSLNLFFFKFEQFLCPA